MTLSTCVLKIETGVERWGITTLFGIHRKRVFAYSTTLHINILQKGGNGIWPNSCRQRAACSGSMPLDFSLFFFSLLNNANP